MVKTLFFDWVLALLPHFLSSKKHMQQKHHPKKNIFHLKIFCRPVSFYTIGHSQQLLQIKKSVQRSKQTSQLPSQSPPCLQNALTPSPNMLPATGATIMAELGGSFNCSIIYDTIEMPVALFSVSTFL